MLRVSLNFGIHGKPWANPSLIQGTRCQNNCPSRREIFTEFRFSLDGRYTWNNHHIKSKFKNMFFFFLPLCPRCLLCLSFFFLYKQVVLFLTTDLSKPKRKWFPLCHLWSVSWEWGKEELWAGNKRLHPTVLAPQVTHLLRSQRHDTSLLVNRHSEYASWWHPKTLITQHQLQVLPMESASSTQ